MNWTLIIQILSMIISILPIILQLFGVFTGEK